MIVNEIVTKFAYVGDSDELVDYNDALGSTIKGMAAFTAAAGAAAAAIAVWANSVLQSIDPLVQLSRETGVSVAKMQELGYIASVSGSSIDAVTSTMQSLTAKIGEAANRGSEDFARLGISIRDMNGNVKDADVVLGEVQNRMRGFSQAQQVDFINRLGIDPSMLQLLQRTNQEMAMLGEEARAYGLISQEQADDVASANDAMTKLKFSFSAVQQQIAIGLAPELSDLADWFRELIEENKEWVMDVMKGSLTIFRAFGDMIQRLAPLLAILGAAFVAMKLYTLGWAGAIKLLTAPFRSAFIMIGALILIIDDLMVAFSGGESAIVGFVEEIFGIDIQPYLEEWVNQVSYFIEDVVAMFTKLEDTIKDTFDFAVDGVSDVFSDVFGGTDAAQYEREALARYQAQRASNSVTQDVNITITTDNPQEAARGVRTGLNQGLNDAHDQVNRGGQ